MKQIYRIEIRSKTDPNHVFAFWLDRNQLLTADRREAYPCTEDEYFYAMKTINFECTTHVEAR